VDFVKQKNKVELKDVKNALAALPQKVLSAANVAAIEVDATNGKLKFSATTLGKDQPILLTINLNPETGQGDLIVNCADSIYGTQLANKLKQELFGT